MSGVKYILAILILIIGIMIGLGISALSTEEVNMPAVSAIYDEIYKQREDVAAQPPDLTLQRLAYIPEEKKSPSDRIKERDIKVYNKRVSIEIDNAILARFTDTKSMEPVLNKDTNAIEVIPKEINDIKTGDIISYESRFSEGIIIHRVIEKGLDEKGPYFRTKGDNLDYTDPEKIRFEQIKRVVVGIIY